MPVLSPAASKEAVRVLIHFPQQSTAPSSMSHYCDLLVEGLGKRGYEVRIVSKKNLLETTKRRVWRMLLLRTPAILSTWPELLRECYRCPKLWLVNISQEYMPPFAGSRSINVIHDLIQLDYPRSRSVRLFYRHLLPRLARHAALNISVSNSTAGRLAAMRVSSQVVYNEFRLPDLSKSAVGGVAPRKFAACWVGTASKHKNVAEFFLAASKMPDKAFAAILPQGDAGRLSIDPKVPTNVELFHSLSAERYCGLLRASNFLVSTSLTEGFGRPPAEGALAGCALVLTDIPIYRELYEGLAHFYKPGDTAGLIAALSNVPSDISDRALGRIQEWSKQYSLVEVIDKAISGAS
jgi:glycosyltransferase involved in cell wall biosynthesis